MCPNVVKEVFFSEGMRHDFLRRAMAVHLSARVNRSHCIKWNRSIEVVLLQYIRSANQVKIISNQSLRGYVHCEHWVSHCQINKNHSHHSAEHPLSGPILVEVCTCIF